MTSSLASFHLLRPIVCLRTIWTCRSGSSDIWRFPSSLRSTILKTCLTSGVHKGRLSTDSLDLVRLRNLWELILMKRFLTMPSKYKVINIECSTGANAREPSVPKKEPSRGLTVQIRHFIQFCSKKLHSRSVSNSYRIYRTYSII